MAKKLWSWQQLLGDRDQALQRLGYFAEADVRVHGAGRVGVLVEGGQAGHQQVRVVGAAVAAQLAETAADEEEVDDLVVQGLEPEALDEPLEEAERAGEETLLLAAEGRLPGGQGFLPEEAHD